MLHGFCNFFHSGYVETPIADTTPASIAFTKLPVSVAEVFFLKKGILGNSNHR